MTPNHESNTTTNQFNHNSPTRPDTNKSRSSSENSSSPLNHHHHSTLNLPLLEHDPSSTSPSPPLSQTRTRIRTAIFGICIFAAMSIATDWWAHAQFNTFRYPWVYQTSHVTNPRTSSWKSIAQNYRGGLPVCDPFAEPGSVIFNETFYHDTNWVPFASSCPPSPDYLSALRAILNVPVTSPIQDRYQLIQHPSYQGHRLEGQDGESRDHVDLWGRPYPNLDFLRGKSILILGDSVDRNGLQHFHELLGANFRGFSYTDIDGPVPEGWDPRSTPWEVELGLLHDRNRNATDPKNPAAQFAGLNARVVNGFFYGLDDINEFSVQGDWHAPGLAEQRIEELFRPMMDQFASEDKEGPAFISIQSGMWDLAFFGRRNRDANMTTEDPLTAVQLDWWQNRMRSVIQTLKLTWPQTPIWLRKTHRVGDKFFWASHDWNVGLKNGMGEGFVNFFSDVRVHQLQEMQEQVAHAEGIPIFDWGRLWEGYQKYQDKVHPRRIPGGVLMNQALLHHVWMESVGRENWDPSLTARLGPLPHPPRP